MKTTLNDILTEALKGKQIVVYEYDALFIYKDERRISHWYINDDDEERLKSYKLNTHWDDLQIKERIGTVVSVSGYHMDYEGTSISMVVNVGGEDKHVTSVKMEDVIQLKDK